MPYLTPPPDPNPRAPRYRAPAGAVDCHIHLFGPQGKYAFDPASPYISEDALPETYIALQHRLGLSRAVIVSGAGYGRNTAHLLDTLARFPQRFRGVALPPEDVTDAELSRMRGMGVRGARFFSGARWSHLPMISSPLARRVVAQGWHIQFYPHGPDLVDYKQALLNLDATIVLDHFAGIPAEQGVNQPAMKALLEMLDTGRVWVKISGPMRCCPGDYPYAPVTPIARHLVTHAPERLVWASDWPHTNMVGRKMPNDGDLFDLFTQWVEDEAVRRRILVDNPAALYGFGNS